MKAFVFKENEYSLFETLEKPVILLDTFFNRYWYPNSEKTDTFSQLYKDSLTDQTNIFSGKNDDLIFTKNVIFRHLTTDLNMCYVYKGSKEDFITKAVFNSLTNGFLEVKVIPPENIELWYDENYYNLQPRRLTTMKKAVREYIDDYYIPMIPKKKQDFLSLQSNILDTPRNILEIDNFKKELIKEAILYE